MTGPFIELRPPKLGLREYADRTHIFSSQEAGPSLPPLERDYMITSSGRKAIALILEDCGLKPSDEVLVTTTFNKPNVSSCVTSTIFNYCKPSRVLSDSTGAVLVIHEFGVPHPQVTELRSLCRERQIPLIEDCAHTVDSRWPDGLIVGSAGDYVIYSLSKLFPITSGGLVFGLEGYSNQDIEELRVIDSFAANLPGFWSRLPTFSARRKALLRRAAERLRGAITVVTGPSENITPWLLPVFVSTPASVLRYLRAQQIECGLWHGSNIIVLPLHQYLTDMEMDFMVSHLLSVTSQLGTEK
jgi:DegT/DnrJ/EryC1/StrS aminotransferase family